MAGKSRVMVGSVRAASKIVNDPMALATALAEAAPNPEVALEAGYGCRQGDGDTAIQGPQALRADEAAAAERAWTDRDRAYVKL